MGTKVCTAVPDSIIYDSVDLGLRKLDLWPPKDADNVSQSFEDLRTAIMDLKFSDYLTGHKIPPPMIIHVAVCWISRMRFWLSVCKSGIPF
jgi:hypothetical protein